ncbi:MAG: bile acid:sodium symporter [Rhodocyclaceae bacterium]|nr:bile acid:sodium symporter [Rhodocyclaceae bacterium]
MFEYLQPLSKLAVLAFVIFTMLGVGLLMSASQLLELLLSRRKLAVTLVANLIIVPFVALALGRLLNLETPLQIALLLIATAAGSPALVKLTALAKGDQVGAVTMIVTLMVISVAYQPLVLPLLIQGVQVDSAEIMRTLGLTVLLPLVIGLLARARMPALALRVQPGLTKLSSLSAMLVMITLPMIHFSELAKFAHNGGILAALVYVAIIVGTGWWLGGGQSEFRRTLALCCGQGNMAAAFVVATQSFSDPKVVVMLLVIFLVSMVLLIPLALTFARNPLSPPDAQH